MNGSRRQIYWRDGWDMRKSRLKGSSKVVKGVLSDGKVNKCNKWLSLILNLDRMTGKVVE
jgi:hypothetical protein